MAPTRIQCQFDGCAYAAEHEDINVAVAMLNSHVPMHARTGSTTPKGRAPPIDRPAIGTEVSEEGWSNFADMWKEFKNITRLETTEAAAQLFQCCDQELAKLLINSVDGALEKSEADLLAVMKELSVIKVAKSVRRSDLLSLTQGQGESTKCFMARVRSKAMTCGHTIKCQGCSRDVDYTREMIKDVLIHGLYDSDIKQDVLGLSDLDNKDVPNLITYIEAKEMAREAVCGTGPSMSAISSYGRSNKQPRHTEEALRARKGKCETCNREMNLFFLGKRGWNKTAFKQCMACFKTNIVMKRPANPARTSKPAEASDIAFGLCGIQTADPIILNHHVFSNGAWETTKFLAHPKLRLSISTHRDDYMTPAGTRQSQMAMWTLSRTPGHSYACGRGMSV
jgi:hypothetical protein